MTIGINRVGANSADTVFGGTGHDFILGNGGNDVLFGLDGNDTVQGGNGNDTLFGNSGNDTIVGGSGLDWMYGGFGDDTYYVDNSNDIILMEYSGWGIDTLYTSARDYQVYADVENIFLIGNAISVIGGNPSNYIKGNNFSNVLQGGDRGQDTLIGGIGNDTLIGSIIGNSTLVGGVGNDVLTGGLNSDEFVFNSDRKYIQEDLGVDRLTNFDPSEDKIILSKTTFTALKSPVGNGFSNQSDFAVVSSNIEVNNSSAAIIYNRNNGNLYYNQDAALASRSSSISSRGSALIDTNILETGLFANFTNRPQLTADNFVIRNNIII